MSLTTKDVDKTAKFDKVTQMDRLKDAWVISFLAEHSDISSETLVDIAKRDLRAPYELFCFLTEWPFTLRFNSKCI
eukprot:3297240-Lingulodinium_polyedra.AAC.1